MKEKKYFLFILSILMLFTLYSNSCLAQQPQSLKILTKSSGVMESSASGTSQGQSAAVRAFHGGYAPDVNGARKFQWVTNGKVPGKKSARGALDGSTVSNKGNTFTTTVLADSIKIGQEADGSNAGVYKGFLSFDTSGIPQDAADISMSLVVYLKNAVINNGGRDFYLEVFKSVYTDPLWNPDWGSVIGPAQEAGVSRVYVQGHSYLPDPEAYNVDPNVGKYVIQIRDPLSLLDTGGNTRIALVSSQSYVDSASQNSGVGPIGQEYVEIYSFNEPKKELRPALLINYNGSSPQIKPALSFLAGDTYYKDTAAQPDQVYEGTTAVTFRVRYVSAAADGSSGTAPAVHQLLLDLNGNGTYDDAGEQVEMTPVDPTDTDYSDGKVYQAVVNVVSTGSSISYQFRFTDGATDAVGTPATKQLLNAIQTSKDSKSSNNLCFISSINW